MLTLYHILLETKELTFSAEVGAETTDDAIELFYIWLIDNGVNDPFIVQQDALFNGDHIGIHAEEEVLEGTVKVSCGQLFPRRVSFPTWQLMQKSNIQEVCRSFCFRIM